MCRYAFHRYRQKYACFACRKSYKSLREKLPAPCPQCGEPMVAMGMDFAAPRQTDVRQWRKLAILVRPGCTFHSCGCGGPGPRPATLREVPAFLAEQEMARKTQTRARIRWERAEELRARRKRRREALAGKREAQVVAVEARAADGPGGGA